MSNATVLVVDDEPLIRWSLVNRLKEEGYRTVEAGTGADAVLQHRDGVDSCSSTLLCLIQMA
jgi:CheY-like chemotaxis protein